MDQLAFWTCRSWAGLVAAAAARTPLALARRGVMAWRGAAWSHRPAAAAGFMGTINKFKLDLSAILNLVGTQVHVLHGLGADSQIADSKLPTN